MFLSTFDIFKISIGPSSSHTMGPMIAANEFLSKLRAKLDAGPNTNSLQSIKCHLYGSLAFTCKGHATDRAVILGLSGFQPATLDIDEANRAEEKVRSTKELIVPGVATIPFDPEKDLILDFEAPLPEHPNGMIFKAETCDGSEIISETYFSVGGGFIATAEELAAKKAQTSPEEQHTRSISNYPYPFVSATEMLEMGAKHNKTIAEMKRANEVVDFTDETLNEKLDEIWTVMNDSIERGLNTDGVLPGGLEVTRRAKAIKLQLEDEQRKKSVQPHSSNEWLCAFAMAVNEVNAAGGKVITSPTNGAAGVIPAVLKYSQEHYPKANENGIHTFLLTAAAIGGLIKQNASISGAEMGCQGEVGSASAMAAAGLCAVLGGSNEQIENAAEIALEHHLGLTCDPVKGLVQVPCIERNGIGAIKAVSAATLALRGDGKHFMPLDNCIETMRQTGLDMNKKYKETSMGGLAVNFPEC